MTKIRRKFVDADYGQMHLRIAGVPSNKNPLICQLGKIDMLGHHTGAKVATEMAFQRPNDTGSIVMVSALVLTEQEREDFASQFQPIPLDEAGTRFTHMWAQAIKYRGPNVSLEQLAFSVAENLRSGEAYECSARRQTPAKR